VRAPLVIACLVASLAPQSSAAQASCSLWEVQLPTTVSSQGPLGPGDPARWVVVRGTSGKQALALFQDGETVRVSLDCNGNGSYQDPGDVFARNVDFVDGGIDVQLGGSDVITFLSASAPVTPQLTLQIVLGGGKNRVELAVGDSLATTGKALLVDISGGVGADTVVGTVGRVAGSSLQIRADLGAGNDIFDLDFAGNMTAGAVVGVQALLGAGANTAHIGKSLSLSNATLQIDVEGGTGADLVDARLSGSLTGGRYLLNAELGGGNDTFTGSLDFASLSLVSSEVRVRALGGAGNDSLTVGRAGTFGSVYFPSGVIEADLKGGLGGDTLVLDLGGNALEANGAVRLREDGGAGDDRLALEAQLPGGTSPRLDIALAGGVGNDTVDFDFVTAGTNTVANYPLAGSVILDAGLGVDSCAVSGNGLVHRRGCEP